MSSRKSSLESREELALRFANLQLLSQDASMSLDERSLAMIQIDSMLHAQQVQCKRAEDMRLECLRDMNQARLDDVQMQLAIDYRSAHEDEHGSKLAQHASLLTFDELCHQMKIASPLPPEPTIVANKLTRSCSAASDNEVSHMSAHSNPSAQNKENVGQGKSTFSTRARNDLQKVANPFKTAKERYELDVGRPMDADVGSGDAPPPVPRRKKQKSINNGERSAFNPGKGLKRALNDRNDDRASAGDDDVDPRYEGFDPECVERVKRDVLESGCSVTFEMIAGLEAAKQALYESVIWPMKRPDLFTGNRKSAKGLLLFGPPGTGKTLVAKAIATAGGSTFFSISSSSLTSKWIGEGEKMVKTLFKVAQVEQPSVIFIDEIDSLLSARSSEENEASRRIKTEFLVQLDGAGSDAEAQVMLLGATNRPQELDEAARRRFMKKFYIGLPGFQARKSIVMKALERDNHSLVPQQIDSVALATKGYSGSDLSNLVKEAAFGPIRELSSSGQVDIDRVDSTSIRPIAHGHYQTAMRSVRASVSPDDLGAYFAWNEEHGSTQIEEAD